MQTFVEPKDLKELEEKIIQSNMKQTVALNTKIHELETRIKMLELQNRPAPSILTGISTPPYNFDYNVISYTLNNETKSTKCNSSNC